MKDREQALDTAMLQIERQFGKGSIMKLGDSAHRKIEHISTGALALDLALGIGGVPRGRIVEVYGRSRAARRPWPCTSWRRPSATGGSPRSSMRNTRSTRSMRRRWGWTSTSC